MWGFQDPEQETVGVKEALKAQGGLWQQEEKGLLPQRGRRITWVEGYLARCQSSSSSARAWRAPDPALLPEGGPS